MKIILPRAYDNTIKLHYFIQGVVNIFMHSVGGKKIKIKN